MFQNERELGAKIAARAPGINAVAFVIGFDQLRGTVAVEVTRVNQRPDAAHPRGTAYSSPNCPPRSRAGRRR